MEILGKEVEVAFLKDRKILAFSLSFEKDGAKEHIKRVTKFHKLEGKIVKSKHLERKLKKRILNALEGKREKIELKIYRFSRVYEELLKVERGKIITYGELAKRSNLHLRQVIFALKFNPFPIIIPCHRVVSKTGFGGYTPLGREFKNMILKIEGVKKI